MTFVDADARVSELYADGWSALVGLLVSVGGTRADAEEVAQGAYEKLIRSWPRVRHYDDPQAWVRTVAVRDLISRHRRSVVAVRKRAVLAQPEWMGGTADDSAQRLDVRDAMASLSIDHRAVLLLHYVEDLGVAAIADTLEVSEGTVKSRLSRARAQLADRLAGPSAQDRDEPSREQR